MDIGADVVEMDTVTDPKMTAAPNRAQNRAN